MPHSDEAQRAAERAARDGYGRLVAFLSARHRDVMAVEDALSQAFLEALQTWPQAGVPRTPEAWLLTVARRRLIDQSRKRTESTIDLTLFEPAVEVALVDADFPDERLKLLFVCAHPAIDPTAQTPLMLQTVLGLDAVAIAKAFIVPASTMGQRLVRAKTRIRDLNIPFVVPTESEWPSRLDSVLNAIYAAYAHGWDNGAQIDGLTDEALYLARMLTKLLPDSAEAHGLLALILHSEARRSARRDGAGNYIPLRDQDASTWSIPLMNEAESHLWIAAKLRHPGPFQLEAAIQSAHNRRAFDGVTPWDDIILFYREIIRLRDTIGARVALAAALAESGQPDAGITELDQLSGAMIEHYQPYWAVRAHLCRRLDMDANAAFQKAIALTNDDAVKAYLRGEWVG